MKKALNIIRKHTKEEVSDEVKGIADEFDVYASLEVLSKSEGGQQLIKNLTADIISIIESLTMKYEKASHVELIASCAGLKSQLDLLRVITRSEKNRKFLEESLEDALQE